MVTAASSITTASDMISPSKTQNPGYRAAITAAMIPVLGVDRSRATYPVRAMVAEPITHSSASCDPVLLRPT